jgi:hypothetical protein
LKKVNEQAWQPWIAKLPQESPFFPRKRQPQAEDGENVKISLFTRLFNMPALQQ